MWTVRQLERDNFSNDCWDQEDLIDYQASMAYQESIDEEDDMEDVEVVNEGGDDAEAIDEINEDSNDEQ